MSDFRLKIHEVNPLPCSVLFIIGGIGTGKSMLGEFTNKFLFGMPNRFPALDTSACIEESKRKNTAAGGALIKLNEQKDKGLVLPADPVVASIFENLQWQHRQHSLLYAVIMGSPRSPQETEILLKLMAARRIDFRVLVVDATIPQMWEGIQRRILGGLLRKDQGPQELVKRLREHRDKTLPAIDAIPKHLKRTVHRSQKFLGRISTLVDHCDVRAGLKQRMLGRIRSDARVIEEIRLIDQKPPLPPELLVMPKELEEFLDEERRRKASPQAQHRMAPRHEAIAA